MYKITLTEFFESKDILAIHCDTEEKADRLLRAFDRMGKKWCNGNSYIKMPPYYLLFGHESCYSNDYHYCELNYYKGNNNKVYEFEEVDLEEDTMTLESLLRNDSTRVLGRGIDIEKLTMALKTQTPAIRSVTLNEKKKITTVVFADGDVKMVKCGEHDTYSPEMGITYCIALKAMGLSKTQYKKMINELIEEK